MFGSDVKRKRLATENGKTCNSEGFRGESEGFGAEDAQTRRARLEGGGQSGARVSSGGECFRTMNWRNTGKDSRWVTLLQEIIEWYSNGLWKSIRKDLPLKTKWGHPSFLATGGVHWWASSAGSRWRRK